MYPVCREGGDRLLLEGIAVVDVVAVDSDDVAVLLLAALLIDLSPEDSGDLEEGSIASRSKESSFVFLSGEAIDDIASLESSRPRSLANDLLLLLLLGIGASKRADMVCLEEGDAPPEEDDDGLRREGAFAREDI